MMPGIQGRQDAEAITRIHPKCGGQCRGDYEAKHSDAYPVAFEDQVRRGKRHPAPIPVHLGIRGHNGQRAFGEEFLDHVPSREFGASECNRVVMQSGHLLPGHCADDVPSRIKARDEEVAPVKKQDLRTQCSKAVNVRGASGNAPPLVFIAARRIAGQQLAAELVLQDEIRIRSGRQPLGSTSRERGTSQHQS